MAARTKVVFLRPLFFYLSSLYPSVPFHQACPLGVLRAHSIKEPPGHSRNPYIAFYHVFGTMAEVGVTEIKSTFFPLRVQSSGEVRQLINR